MRKLDAYFVDYEAHHQTALNRATHSVGIPLISLALLGLGSKVPLFSVAGVSIDLGLALAVALVAAYLVLHVGLALGIAALFAGFYWLGAGIPALWLWVILAAGVALQYVGHYVFEGRAPAFHKNAVHMLVGPLWTASLLFRLLGLYRPRYLGQPGS